MATEKVLIGGQWRASDAASTFRAENAATGEPLPAEYPVSKWSDCDAALSAALEAAAALRATEPVKIAKFLELFAARIEARREAIVELAHQETGYPKAPRLNDVELPRTCDQLRQAAAAAVEGSWTMATLDTKNNIRSYFAPLGPVAVFGPNNFPLAFGSASGGDFAAAIAAGNPVIAKANTSHPGTTRLFAEEALEAVREAGLHPATVQLIYRTSHPDGERFVADPRLGATAYTGARHAGLKLKEAADKAGNPIYLELSSVNPVVILPGALSERADKLVDEFSGSALMGTGQFCTNPGMMILLAGTASDQFIDKVQQKFAAAPVGCLLSRGVAKSLEEGVKTLAAAGAKILVGGKPAEGANRFSNTVLRVDGATFLENAEKLQTEAFGNASLFVVVKDAAEATAVLDKLEGNLTGCIYSDTAGSDDKLYAQIVPHLRLRVGRLLNDKMPTGVAVSPAMNHGGPYPSTGHPGFTAVGIPASLHRFGTLQCYDNVRPERLPPALKDKNPNGQMWRYIDRKWTQGDAG